MEVESRRTRSAATTPRAFSGALRRYAYQFPREEPRRSLTLLLAERFDRLEDRVGEALSGPVERAGFPRLAGSVRSNPVAAATALMAAGYLLRRL